jgi:signal transduction histidine kinase
VVLVWPGELSGSLSRAVQDVARRGNVTLLERPVRVATLTTTLDAALRARARQYEMRDAIAERANLVANERTLRAEAEQANMAKMQFLATMSHELRTPLNAIGGHVQLIELGILGPVTDRQADALRRVRRAESHLLGLINDVLNFAKIEAGHVTFDLEPTTIGELFEEMDSLIEPQVRAKGLSYSRPTNCNELRVVADLDKARQVLLNLLSNAVKFTPPGGRVTLWCEAAGDAVRVHVGDTGIGIPDDKLGSIFDPFVQVNAGYTRTSEGTGLGLSISRDLARAMGGELTVRSAPGEGSSFTLTLPVPVPSPA